MPRKLRHDVANQLSVIIFEARRIGERHPDAETQSQVEEIVEASRRISEEVDAAGPRITREVAGAFDLRLRDLEAKVEELRAARAAGDAQRRGGGGDDRGAGEPGAGA